MERSTTTQPPHDQEHTTGQLVQRRWPMAALAAGILIAGSVVVWRWKKT
jgi:hypothetical protein